MTRRKNKKVTSNKGNSDDNEPVETPAEKIEESEDVYTCFVIMPFSATENHDEIYWTNHFEKFLKMELESVGKIKVKRSEAIRGDIIKEIIFDLINSDIVVADLTDHNPNVFWELGVRQSFSNSTITIAENGTKLPFDISSKGTLFYHPQDYIKNEMFCRQLENAVRDCIENPQKPDSVVLETISGRGTIYEIINKEENYRKISGLYKEMIFNKKKWDYIKDMVLKNQEKLAKNQDDLSIFTTRFSTFSIQYFLTTCYLDLNHKLYKELEKILDEFIIINEQINIMQTLPVDASNWLFDAYIKNDTLTKHISDVENNLDKEKEIFNKVFK